MQLLQKQETGIQTLKGVQNLLQTAPITANVLLFHDLVKQPLDLQREQLEVQKMDIQTLSTISHLLQQRPRARG